MLGEFVRERYSSFQAVHAVAMVLEESIAENCSGVFGNFFPQAQMGRRRIQSRLEF